MKCPRCQHENPGGAKFCEECAAPLARVCSNCGGPLRETAKFCPECAHPVGPPPGSPERPVSPERFHSPEAYTPRHLAERILTSRTAVEGERKQVSVLFADLKGSMELLADRDPEEARRVLDAVLERMMEAVHRYDGTVNQVMGDGIMALFGAPLALEHHALRACYAALRMQESIGRWAEELQRAEGLAVRVRIGINSGEVVVRSIGSDLHMDYTAVGQTTHLAARMEQMAAPGTILITPATMRMAEQGIRVNAIGKRQVKGLEPQIEVYELLSAAPARSMLGDCGDLGRFAGRQAELARLQQMLVEARAGWSQVAAVTGEPGVGKTRLIREFLRSPAVRDWRVLEAGSLAYEKATSYRPVIDLLRKYFELDEDADSGAVSAKVTAKLLELDAGLDDTVVPVLSLLEALPDEHPFRAHDPRDRRRRVLAALTRIVLKESASRPLIVVFENLQWVDPETRAFLDDLIERALAARLMLLLEYRPEFDPHWPRRQGLNEVPVPPLTPESAEELLQGHVGSGRALAPLRKLVYERSQGNPFFLEEIVRNLAETGALVGERGAYRLASDLQALQVPGTVQAVLAARIDRLGAEEKQLLESASVIGVEVPQALLEAATGQSADALAGALAKLRAAGFLGVVGLFPDIELRFGSALMRDVAYESLLREQRRALHARILEALEALYPERLSAHLDQLAHHATRGEAWPEAVHYNHQLGLRAVERAANSEAVRALETSLQALARLPQTRESAERAIDIRLDLRPPLLQLGRLEDVLAVSRECERLAREIGDEQRLARVYAYLVNYHYLKGETARAIDYGKRCLEVARASGDAALQTLARQYMGQSYHTLGEYERAERVLRENLDSAEGAGAGISFVASCAWLAVCLADRGDFEAAQAALERGRLAAEAANHAYSQTIAWTISGLVSIRRGRPGPAVLPLERSVEACRRKDLTVWRPIATSLLGLALVRLGHHGEGLRFLEDAVRSSRELGIRAYLPAWQVNLAEGYLAGARHAEARATALEALALAQANGERGHEARALALLGDVAAQGGPARAAEALERYAAAIDLGRQLGLRPFLAETLLGASRLQARLGDAPAAARQRAEAEALLGAIGMRAWTGEREADPDKTGSHLFVVKPANTELYEFLSEEFSGARAIKVIFDRRQGGRRQVAPANRDPGERRRSERRRIRIDQDLRDWGLAVAPSRG
jgi:class 3 adenylate cyclase/tetratricopeptide (TPR) repeat protein